MGRLSALSMMALTGRAMSRDRVELKTPVWSVVRSRSCWNSGGVFGGVDSGCRMRIVMSI